jgi:hypothetical protein
VNKIKSLTDFNIGPGTQKLHPTYLKVKFSPGSELIVLLKDSEAFGYFKSSNNNTIAFNSNGKISTLSRQYVENVARNTHQIDQNRERLEVFIEFIHNYQKSFEVFDQKASKKNKLNKKETEKMNLARESMLQGIVNELQTKISKINERVLPLSEKFSSSLNNLISNLFRNSNIEAVIAPGLFTTDLFLQKMKTSDNFGQEIIGHAQHGVSYSPMSYSSALKLLGINVYEPQSSEEIKTFAPKILQEPIMDILQELFDKFIFLINQQSIVPQILSARGNTYRQFETYDSLENIKHSLSKQKNFYSRQRDYTDDFTICDICYDSVSQLKAKQEVTIPTVMNEGMDVIEVKAIEYPKAEDKCILQVFIRPSESLNREKFKKCQEAFQNWLKHYNLVSSMFGSFENQDLSIEIKDTNRKTKLQYFYHLFQPISPIHYADIIKNFIRPRQVTLEKQSSFFEHIKHPRNLNPLVLNNSVVEIHSSVKNLNGLQSSQALTQNRPKLFNTRRSLRELAPKFVSNYFETLIGRNFIIENPEQTKPTILTTKDKSIIANLLEKENNETSKESKIDIQRRSSRFVNSRNSSAIKEKNENQKKLKVDFHKTENNENLIHKKAIIIRNTTCFINPLIETQHIFSKCSQNRTSELSAIEFHKKKTVNFNIYGEPREKLPSVKCLYKQPSDIKLPEINFAQTFDTQNKKIDEISQSIAPLSQIEVRMMKKASSIHQLRNETPHRMLLNNLDKGYKGGITTNFSKTCATNDTQPLTQDIIIFPSIIDFGRVLIDGVYETSFSIVNKGKNLRRLLIKPPLYCPGISLIKEEGPFAPGLMRQVKVVLDASSLKSGAFAEEIIVSSESAT